jgi:hypothetical protein
VLMRDRVLMRNRVLTTLDEAAVIAEPGALL